MFNYIFSQFSGGRNPYQEALHSRECDRIYSKQLYEWANEFAITYTWCNNTKNSQKMCRSNPYPDGSNVCEKAKANQVTGAGTRFVEEYYHHTRIRLMWFNCQCCNCPHVDCIGLAMCRTANRRRKATIWTTFYIAISHPKILTAWIETGLWLHVKLMKAVDADMKAI